jgi:membrane protease YdiL (CAAX protease family)
MDALRQPLAALTGFVLASLVLLAWVAVGSAVALAVHAMRTDIPLEQLAEDPLVAMTPSIMGASALFQAVGMGLVTVLLARWTTDTALERRHAVFGPVRGRWMWWAAAGFGGLTVGFLPGWIASAIIERVPELGGTLEILSETLREPAPVGKTLLVLAICVGAPIFEELAFRGYVWHHLERIAPGWVVWIGSSVVFAAYHVDPVQSPSLLPTALFLGFLRWQSGSIGPCILAHFVNNALATVALLTAGAESDGPISLGFASAGMVFTVVCCLAAFLLDRRTSGPRATPGAPS